MAETKKTADTATRVEAAMATEQELGYRGYVPDPTPNENYTVAGVTSGKPTPETDRDAKEAARKTAADLAEKS